jgi:hypothetical protein
VAARSRAERDADPLHRTGPIEVLTDALVWAGRRQADLARQALGSVGDVVRDPASAPTRAGDVAALLASVRRQLLVTDHSRSPLLSIRSLGRRFENFSIPMGEARAAAKRLGGSLNDFYVTGVAGALGLYHELMGVPVDELRMAMPVNLRDGSSEDANQFAPARVLVPTGPKDPGTRFAAVTNVLRDVRSEPALGAAAQLTGILAALPTALLVNLARSQSSTIDFATSNLRGSPVSLYVGGAEIEANFPMGPRSGVPLNVTLLSYRDSLDMGLNLDPAAITDPAALLGAFDESFAALLAS